MIDPANALQSSFTSFGSDAQGEIDIVGVALPGQETRPGIAGSAFLLDACN